MQGTACEPAIALFFLESGSLPFVYFIELPTIITLGLPYLALHIQLHEHFSKIWCPILVAKFANDFNGKQSLPFYGGARGQILEIRKNSDGTVVSKILRGDDEDVELKVQQVADEGAKQSNEQALDASDEDLKATDQSFGDYLVKIQNAAASLVSLQETVKKTGKLSPDQRKVYTDNLEKLGVAAQKLAHIQQADDDQDAIRFLFDCKYAVEGLTFSFLSLFWKTFISSTLMNDKYLL